MKDKVKEFLLITVGTLLVAAGVYFFKFPNHFSTGGVSGISIILGSVVGSVSPATFVMILNVFLLILGFLVLNKDFGIKTVYCSLLLSGTTWLLEKFVPLSAPLTDQKFLELVYSVLLPAFGSAMLFNANSSTGGTDIVAMILKKYTNIDIGKALLCTDVTIVVIATFVFGIETGLFSLLGLIAKAVMVDAVIENFNTKKSFTIITSKPDIVCEYINNVMKRGATIVQGRGSYTGETRYVIHTVLHRPQAMKLRQYVKSVDKHGFIIISNSSEIIGKGFRSV